MSAKKQELEPVKDAPLPSTTGAAPSFIQGSTGRGLSSKAEDNVVPLIYILQALSPTLQRRDPNYIEGAKVGDIWLRNSPHPIVDGEKGILFQPCFFHKAWVQWRPNRGGFVASFPDRPPEAKEVDNTERPGKKKWVMPNGDDIVETRYHSGFVYPEDDGLPLPYVIPMSSSGHTTSRAWMFMMNAKTVGGQKADSFAGIYRLRTKDRVDNAQHHWSAWDITDAGWVPTEEAYNAGKALFDAFNSGEKTAEAPMEPVAEDEGDNAKM